MCQSKSLFYFGVFLLLPLIVGSNQLKAQKITWVYDEPGSNLPLDIESHFGNYYFMTYDHPSGNPNSTNVYCKIHKLNSQGFLTASITLSEVRADLAFRIFSLADSTLLIVGHANRETDSSSIKLLKVNQAFQIIIDTVIRPVNINHDRLLIQRLKGKLFICGSNREDSSFLYRINPKTLQVEWLFRFDDVLLGGSHSKMFFDEFSNLWILSRDAYLYRVDSLQGKIESSFQVRTMYKYRRYAGSSVFWEYEYISNPQIVGLHNGDLILLGESTQSQPAPNQGFPISYYADLILLKYNLIDRKTISEQFIGEFKWKESLPITRYNQEMGYPSFINFSSSSADISVYKNSRMFSVRLHGDSLGVITGPYQNESYRTMYQRKLSNGEWAVLGLLVKSNAPYFYITDSAGIVHDLGTAINSHKTNTYSLYPNPSHGTFAIESMTDYSFKIEVFTTDGRQVTNQIRYSQGLYHTDGLESGIYVVHIQTIGRTIKKRLIINP